MRIVVISHTEHYFNQDRQICGWGSTIRELDHVAQICDELIHIAPLHKTPAPESSLTYTASNVQFIALEPSGGKGLKKLSILKTLFTNLKKIQRYTKSADYIQFRAPTGMGTYVLPYLKFFRSGKYWVKYAGNWMDDHMPLGNRIQKFWLKKIDKKVKVTINGNWESNPRFLSFENPCLTKEEYEQGQEVISKKINSDFDNLRLVFVGSLNRHKGVHLILTAFCKKSQYTSLSEMIFAGDGAERTEFEEMATHSPFPIKFLGHCSKDEVANLLSQSHVLILPSKSEGFPKVVGEAMNFGCIPVVTDISCMKDYIKNNYNGFLLKEASADSIIKTLNELEQLDFDSYKEALLHNSKLAHRFTYDYYNFALQDKIFEDVYE
ncbi:hypothetical protein BST97_00185 [Nonlabens spongiae]|uniref:Glycosyl transferase family 1 domain-containing protein n=1 Tax=Nonlabens spongiae TaxID=331648 RepID=A0A1W6MGA6_9FLAO|nr:glycosyltransferase [Nonlabens spongiae]ARN76546.1 hypothetical protein BST97_00185 [Nonlabens spongiae]